ncbi:hypothetical protein [Halorussus halophilus]|uniref:hypothetical protein n=1 Tax=Halorussus halophilus TaxID=2650975 RepID=UPI0013012FC8|nr:hypothetical protein [Halorussus halophilus]
MGRPALLYGRDRDVSARFVGLAGLLFAATFVAQSPSRAFGVSVPFGLDFGSLFFFMIAAPTLAAFYNDGALVSLTLALGPALGFFVPMGHYGLTESAPSLLAAVGIGVTTAATMGMCGFLFGYVGRRLVDSYR